MFEILTFLAECIIKVIESLLRKDDVKNRTELGGDLMHAYYALNRAILLGDDILKLLEAYVARFSYFAEHPYAETQVREAVGRLLHKQAESLDQIGRFVKAYDKELQVVDGRSYRALRILLGLKVGAIRRLIVIMESDGIVTNQAAVVECAVGKDESDESTEGFDLFSRDYFERAHDAEDMVLESAYSLRPPPIGQIPEQLRDYISSGEGRKRLDDLEAIADSLRTSIVQEFSAAELVMHVRDARFDESMVSRSVRQFLKE